MKEKYDDKNGKIKYGMKTKEYNPETHVKVRVLHHEELPIDFDTGIKKIDPHSF